MKELNNCENEDKSCPCQSKGTSSHLSKIDYKPNNSTYLDRVSSFFSRTNVKHSLHSENYIKECIEIVELASKNDWEKLEAKNITKDKVAEANIVVLSTTRPPKNQIINPFFRLSSFTAVNIPICAGLLLSPPTLFNTIFYQWITQTYNSFFNYSNSSNFIANDSPHSVKCESKCKFTPSSIIDFAKNINFSHVFDCTMKNIQNPSIFLQSYFLATTLSVSVAVGLNHSLKRVKHQSRLLTAIQACVPFISCTSASVSNLVLVRMDEMKTGIPVYTSSGEYVGHSRNAAKRAIFETLITRIGLCIPTLLLPPPILWFCTKNPFIERSRISRSLVEMLVVCSGLYIGIPFAAALYPTEMKLKPHELESEIIGKSVKYASDILHSDRGL